MSHLILASANPAPAGQPAAQWAHDIRNALATVGLHLETLERLSGSRGREIARAAHALMARAAAMCNDAMEQETHADFFNRRRGFDVIRTIVQVANLLRPVAPEGFEIRVAGNGTFSVLADPQDVFRILFNLAHNAIAAARQEAKKERKMTSITLMVERAGAAVRVLVTDDGPGLPQAVRLNLFRPQGSALPAGGGLGLAIARELAERNGGMLQLVESARGTTFVLELSGLTALPSAEPGAMRSLGKRAPH